METVKLGSKGEAVKKLQKLLGIKDDGIFGNQTEKAVKDFQKEHNLVVDGIVGNKTWSILLNNNDEIDIVKTPINVHITKLKNRPIKYIAIHYTAGGSSKPGSAQAVKRAFENRPASADFAVDDRDIVQFNPDLENYYCWSVGDKKNPYSSGGEYYCKATNKNTISIEVCSNLKKGITSEAAKYANHEGWYFTEEALENAKKLVRYLMKKYGVIKGHVVRHYDISGKLCPGIIGWNNENIYTIDGKRTNEKSNSKKWEEFYNSI